LGVVAAELNPVLMQGLAGVGDSLLEFATERNQVSFVLSIGD
jgi:hypothetical protein